MTRFEWFKIWASAFCAVVWNKDRYHDPLHRFGNVIMAGSTARIIANTCKDIDKERRNMTVLEQIEKETDVRLLGEWYCSLNCWEWPEAMLCDKPNLDTMATEEAAKLLGPLIVGIKNKIGRRECSRAWWVHKLNRPEKDWLAWWKAENPATDSVKK